MSPAPDERDLIRASMDRILGGTPERSNGALTIVALALEAGVPRNALTQRHTDLKNEFYDKVRARGGTPDSEQRLRKQVRRLKELRAADTEEIAQLKADVEALRRRPTPSDGREPRPPSTVGRAANEGSSATDPAISLLATGFDGDASISQSIDQPPFFGPALLRT
ncbi:hypothetical protein [Streptomyces sp. NBC_00893]|uniref:hypothetical protein n=1 Tax=Streptomyces sp. NBC_00893 TaxID=2975862 RepID=UPI002254E731|nr:hypothetical protein [Streptomyces sp. NBC_00893]MCX4851897.1 hypothetical protein [Streptomyces sp. NBC_00893]